jgi:hypothetical protein
MSRHDGEFEERDRRLTGCFPSVPDRLEFESRWCEGTGRDTRWRRIAIHFTTATSVAQVITDDARVPLSVALVGRDGRPLRAWDLCVGCTIDVLGRGTTLQSASFASTQWFDENARRLWQLKERLEARALKFRAAPAPALDYPPFRKLQKPVGEALGGRVCPGTIARCILELEDELANLQ